VSFFFLTGWPSPAFQLLGHGPRLAGFLLA